MSLNNEQMLPARSRNMRQMNELLNAEDIIIEEIESIIDSMYERAAMLHEELVNEAWLEHRLNELIGGTLFVEKCEGQLKIHIDINVGKLNGEKEELVIGFLNKYLPAHLAYEIVYEKDVQGTTFYAAIWHEMEVFEIRQVMV